jgi:hypothetical protein
VRRAARYDGLYPVDVDETDLRRMIDEVAEVRGNLDGFEVIARPGNAAEYRVFEEIGATWAITGPGPGDDGVLELASTHPAVVFAVDA